MLAGKAECQILGYGKVRLTLSKPRGVKEITLHKVAYILGFLTNIASLDQMNKKDVHWDSQTRELYHTNRVLCYTLKYYGQTVLQYVPIDASFFVQKEESLRQTKAILPLPQQAVETIVQKENLLDENIVTLFSSRKLKVLKGTLQDWHKRIGHLNH